MDRRATSLPRPLARLVPALAAVLLLATPVTADTELGSQGRVGRHALRDTHQRPGLVCAYSDPTGVLQRMTVRPPQIRARDVTPARDAQTVDWRVIVQYPDVNGFWGTAATQGPWSATARDDTPAAFTARAFDPPLGMGARYRVLVVMRWWRGGSVEGRSRHRVDWVQRRTGETVATLGPNGACPEHLGA